MENLGIILVVVFLLVCVLWKYIFKIILFLFVPKIVEVRGEISELQEWINPIPSVIDFNDNIVPKYSNVEIDPDLSYAVKVWVMELGKYLYVKISRSLYLELEKDSDKDSIPFSMSCHKYFFRRTLFAIEPETEPESQLNTAVT